MNSLDTDEVVIEANAMVRHHDSGSNPIPPLSGVSSEPTRTASYFFRQLKAPIAMILVAF